jgi:hypothetical protein
MMRLLIILTGFIFCNCKPSQQTAILQSEEINQQDFTLLAATYENWASGIRGGASGRDYFFKIFIQVNEQLAFDSVWINYYSYPLITSKDKTTVNRDGIKISIDDTIILKVSDIYSKEIKKVISPPMEYAGNALIRYTKGTDIKYFTVKEIKEQVPVNRP